MVVCFLGAGLAVLKDFKAFQPLGVALKVIYLQCRHVEVFVFVMCMCVYIKRVYIKVCVCVYKLKVH